MSTDLPVPTDPQPPVPKPRTQLKEYQLDVIARLSAMNANTPEQISITTGIPLAKITALYKGSNKTFNTLQSHYKELVMRHHTGAMMDMVEKLPKCSQAIDGALESGDARLAKDTAFEIYDRVLPEMNPRLNRGKPETEINLSFTHNNPQAAVILNETMDSVADMVRGLKDHLALEGEVISHELIGEQALPTPPGQLEVGGGEALPSVEDSDPGDHLDLIDISEGQ